MFRCTDDEPTENSVYTNLGTQWYILQTFDFGGTTSLGNLSGVSGSLSTGPLGHTVCVGCRLETQTSGSSSGSESVIP